MTIYYSLVNGPDGSVLSVVGGLTLSITSDSPHFDEAVDYLTKTLPEDVDEVYITALMDPRTGVSEYIKRVSDRVAFSGSQLLFDGDPVNNSLSETIIRLSREDSDGDPAKLVKFMENLMNNPSEHSREQLYDWIAPRNITITHDGHFLAYKGLRGDYSSINAGPGTVNNQYFAHSNLDNSPGNIVEFSRSKVDADSSVGCSVGLHAGTYEYASGFAQGKLVLVKINPRDVVSVPADCNSQKLRVCRYEVLEEVHSLINKAVWLGEDEEEDDDDYFDEDDGFYDEDDGFDEDDEDEDYGFDEDGEDEESSNTYSVSLGGYDDPLRYLRGFGI